MKSRLFRPGFLDGFFLETRREVDVFGKRFNVETLNKRQRWVIWP